MWGAGCGVVAREAVVVRVELVGGWGSLLWGCQTGCNLVVSGGYRCDEAPVAMCASVMGRTWRWTRSVSGWGLRYKAWGRRSEAMEG